MTVLVVAALALAAPPQVDNVAVTDSAMKAHELRAAAQSALSAEANAADRDTRLLAVADVVRVYDRLKTNPNIAYRDKVRLRTKLRSRLNKVAADLKCEAKKSPNGVETTADSIATGAGGGQGVPDPGEALIELIESTVRPESWRDAGGRGVMVARGPRGRAVGAAAVGGGGGFGGGIHGGGAGGAVQAEALIELIENTVRPETWEVNGGRGTIMYWRGS